MAASFLTILMSEMLKYEQKYLLGMMSFLVWDQILEGFKAKVGNASSSPKRGAGRRPGRTTWRGGRTLPGPRSSASSFYLRSLTLRGTLL